MIIICQSCGARYKINEKLVASGAKRAKCKKCGNPMLIKPPAEKAETTVESAPAPSTGDSVQVKEETADVTSKTAAESVEKPAQNKEEAARVAPGSETSAGAPSAPPEPASEEAKEEKTAEPEPGRGSQASDQFDKSGR